MVGDYEAKALIRHTEIKRGQDKATTTIHTIVANASNASLKEHRKTSAQFAQGQSEVLERLDRIDPKGAGQLSPAVKSGRRVLFIGESADSLITPLSLLREHLRSTILKAVSQDLKAYPEHLFQILSEVERLHASALQEAAASIPGSSATPFDDWSYTGRVVGARGQIVQTDALRRHLCREKDEVHTVSGLSNAIRRHAGTRKILHFYTPVGDLDLFVSHPDDVQASACDAGEIGVLFVPKAGISTMAVAARFLMASGVGPEPRLYTQLNAFCVVADIDPHLDLIGKGTIEEIDTAFRTGVISPYHIYEYGQPLCLYVSYHDYNSWQ